MAGDRDPVITSPAAQKVIARLQDSVPRLHRTVMLSGCGHWTQQERPQAVNDALLEFLQVVRAAEAAPTCAVQLKAVQRPPASRLSLTNARPAITASLSASCASRCGSASSFIIVWKRRSIMPPRSCGGS